MQLEIAGVTKRFGGLVAVSNVNLTLKPGQVHGLIGPNGAGKSTMIALISGFMWPDAGTVMLGGQDLAGLAPHVIAQRGISRTFQQAAPLIGLNVFENIMVGMHTRYRASLLAVLLSLPATRKESHDIAAAVADLLDRFDLADCAEAGAESLTFGQLRFLEIARALAMRPKILLLDEPAAGLNQVETEKLASIIRQLRQDGMSVLLIDHDVPFVFGICDEITIMNYGEVIASGKPDAIYNNAEVRAAYLGTEISQVGP